MTHCLPIYGGDDQGKPYLIGSSLLLDVGDKLLLVSAAHVLDWNKDTSLYAAGPVKPMVIEGDSYRTQAPKAGRDEDLADVGIVDVSNVRERAMVSIYHLDSSRSGC